MNKKEILIPISFLTLSLLFIAICFMVYLSGNKSKKWIARKMKIGSLLLALNAASCNTTPEPTCYMTESYNNMLIPDIENNTITLNTDSSVELKGKIYGRHNLDFSFSISDKEGKIIQKGNIYPVDSAFNSSTEEFRLSLDKSIRTGTYQLKLFASTIQAQDTVQAQNDFKLILIHE